MHTLQPVGIGLCVHFGNARVDLYLLFDSVVLIIPLSVCSFVRVLQRCRVVPLLMAQALLIEDVGQPLPLAVEGLLAVVSVSRVNNAPHRQILDLVALHLHMDPLFLGAAVEHER